MGVGHKSPRRTIVNRGGDCWGLDMTYLGILLVVEMVVGVGHDEFLHTETRLLIVHLHQVQITEF